MANKTLTQATALAGADIAGTDELWIWDVTAAALKKTTRAELIGGIVTGGGTLATGGYTLTVPATGAAALNADATWTPQVAFAGNTTQITYSTQNGWYCKVGNVVVASFYLVLTNKGGNSGDATIVGFPYAGKAGYPFAGSIQYAYLTASLTSNIYTVLIADVLYLYGNTAAAQTSPALTAASLANNTILLGSVAYFIA